MNYVRAVLCSLNDQLYDLDLDVELLRLYALLVFVVGTDVTLVDVHNAWSIWRDMTDPDHRSLIPFDQLTDDVQQLDEPYRAAIATVAKGHTS